MNKKIRLASIFGGFFLVVAVVKQLLTPLFHQIQPASYAAFYAYFSAFTLLMVIFFGTYLVSFFGYLHIASKYHIRGLKTATWIMMGAIVIAGLAIVVAAFQLDMQRDAAIINDVAFFALMFYMIDPFVIGIFVARLKRQLGFVAFAPAAVGFVIAVYGIYSYGLPALGFHVVAFLGNFVFIPIPEAAYVIASIVLFRKAANERV